MLLGQANKNVYNTKDITINMKNIFTETARAVFIF